MQKKIFSVFLLCVLALSSCSRGIEDDKVDLKKFNSANLVKPPFD